MLSSEEDTEALEDLDVAAVSAGRLVYNGNVLVSSVLEEKSLSAIRSAVEQSGATELLRISGSSSALSGSAASTAAVLADAVEQGGYDGLLLDLSNLREEQGRQLTSLVQQTAAKLGDKLLYVMADAPDGQDGSTGAYDLAALGSAADKLVLRVDAYEKTAEELTVAPWSHWRNSTAPWLSSTVWWLRTSSASVSPPGVCWTGGKRSGTMNAQQIQALAESGARSYYSSRYELRISPGKRAESSLWCGTWTAGRWRPGSRCCACSAWGRCASSPLTERTTQLPGTLSGGTAQMPKRGEAAGLSLVFPKSTELTDSAASHRWRRTYPR